MDPANALQPKGLEEHVKPIREGSVGRSLHQRRIGADHRGVPAAGRVSLFLRGVGDSASDVLGFLKPRHVRDARAFCPNNQMPDGSVYDDCEERRVNLARCLDSDGQRTDIGRGCRRKVPLPGRGNNNGTRSGRRQVNDANRSASMPSADIYLQPTKSAACPFLRDCHTEGAEVPSELRPRAMRISTR